MELNKLYYKKKSLLVDNVCTIQALFVTKPLHYISSCFQDNRGPTFTLEALLPPGRPLAEIVLYPKRVLHHI